MNIIVQKYGGSSVKDVDRLKEIANWIKGRKLLGEDIVVVVSAQGKMTDSLIGKAMEITNLPHGRELDALLSAGEQVSSALLAMALKDIGVDAISFNALQLNIKTNNDFNNAKIIDIDKGLIFKSLREGKVVVVTGFQGIDNNKNITTLGRGGSDTSAVAIGAALEAKCVEIYTDVDGVYSADPRIVENSIKLNNISYNNMIEMAGKGAKVLHPRSVELAAKYGIIIHLRSSFTWKDGTFIGGDYSMLEQAKIDGVTHMKNLGSISVRALEDILVLEEALEVINDSGVDVKLINQNEDLNGKYEITLLLDKVDAIRLSEELIRRLDNKGNVALNLGLGMVSATGVGIKSSKLQGKMLKLLHSNGIPTKMLSSSEISFSYVISEVDVEKAKISMHRELVEKYN